MLQTCATGQRHLSQARAIKEAAQLPTHHASLFLPNDVTVTSNTTVFPPQDTTVHQRGRGVHVRHTTHFTPPGTHNPTSHNQNAGENERHAYSFRAGSKAATYMTTGLRPPRLALTA